MNDHDRDREAASVPTLLAGRYRIISPLGSGGMADVYLAEDERLGRQVAVKVLKARLAADDEFVERFRIEAQAAASLNHPSIVGVYDRGSAEGTTYIAMEYVRGESLKQRLRRDGAFAPDEAVPVALAVLSALAAAHERDIIHRDVTSYNVMLDEGGRVVVTDFGIARMGESALTRTGAMMGTSSYLSPEQAQGRPADERSDLYSLGVVLYEMLTGRVPFRGETDVAVAMQHVSTAPANPRTFEPAVTEALARVVMRALSKNADDRYQTAGEFAAALRQARRPARPFGSEAAAAGAAMPAAAVAPVVAAPVAAVAASAREAAAAAAPSALQPPAPRPSAPGMPRPFAPVAPAPGPTVLVADAPTRYRSGEPATTVQPRRRRKRRIALAVIVLALAAVAGWAAYAFLLAPGPVVPKVVGQSRADAAGAVRDQGLRPVIHYVWADKAAAGEVARQAPRGGESVREGVKVDLWVSRGPLHIPAPDLTGLAAGVARSRLEAQSLSSSRHRAASQTTPKGQIFRQDPAPGATVQRGDTVAFWVSSGPPMITVPDVVGRSQGDAKAALEAEGFTVNSDYVAGWGTMPGDVVGQDPAAGTRGRAGDEVVIQVAVF
jgi:eukaryotic-like serine/threonine-protein kinase